MKKPTIEELLKRIEELEKSKRCAHLTIYPHPTSYQTPQPTPSHYHNAQPCWNSPCVWC